MENWSDYIDLSINTRCAICDGDGCLSCEKGVMIFDVYHRRRMLPILCEDVATVEADYDLVARVEAGNLDDAFRLTQYIDNDWTSAPGVQMCVEKARSSSVGDVFQAPDGSLFRVASVGFVAFDGWADFPVERAVRDGDLAFLNSIGSELLAITEEPRQQQVHGCIVMVETGHGQYQIVFVPADEIINLLDTNDALYWDVMAMISAYGLQHEIIVCMLRQDGTSSAYRMGIQGDITCQRMAQAHAEPRK